MTKKLSEAMDRVSVLSEAMQDEIAAIIIAEISSEERWDLAFAQSHDVLRSLAEEARKEKADGKAKRQGFDEL